jgi:hypothetical protein
MHVVSQAFMDQLDIVQKERCNQGPVEFVFLPPRGENRIELVGYVHQRNSWYRACTARPGESLAVTLDRRSAPHDSEGPSHISS